MPRKDPSPSRVAPMEFAVVREDFSVVCPVAQALFAYARRKEHPRVFTTRQRQTLWRHRARRLGFIGERFMRIIEPVGQPGLTVLNTDASSAILACISALLPSSEFIEIESFYEAQRRQKHGLYVRKAGRIERQAVASVGVESRGWTWRQDGLPAGWEDTSTYTNRSIAKRQTRDTLVQHLRSVGFDVEAYLATGKAARSSRFRAVPGNSL